MTHVMDFMLAHKQTPVIDIRNKFDLTKEQYSMIYDLMAPIERYLNLAGYWKTKYNTEHRAIMARLREEKKHTKLTNDIFQILDGCETGKKNEASKIEIDIGDD